MHHDFFYPFYNVQFRKTKRSNQKHIGTLREVLNSWCSDFGYTWVLDHIFPNRYLGVDLSRPVVDLEEIKKDFSPIVFENCKSKKFVRNDTTCVDDMIYAF